jgi:hypothetical protein
MVLQNDAPLKQPIQSCCFWLCDGHLPTLLRRLDGNEPFGQMFALVKDAGKTSFGA